MSASGRRGEVGGDPCVLGGAPRVRDRGLGDDPRGDLGLCGE